MKVRDKIKRKYGGGVMQIKDLETVAVFALWEAR